jgi:hypothetical protein
MMGKWAEAPSPSSLFSSATIQTTNTESFDKATIERSSDSSSTLDKSNNIIAAASSLAPAPQPFDEAATKNLLRKLDFRLLPFLVLIYLQVPVFQKFSIINNGIDYASSTAPTLEMHVWLGWRKILE